MLERTIKRPNDLYKSEINYCSSHFLVVSVSLIRDREHLEKESQILNVVGAVVVVDGEPEHGMRIWVLVSYDTGSSSGWNQDGGCKGSSSFRRDQTQIVVPFHVLLFQLVQIFDTFQTEFFHFLFDILGEKLGHVLRSSIMILVGRNQVIGLFSQVLADAEWHGGVIFVVLRSESTNCQRSLQAATCDASDSEGERI